MRKSVLLFVLWVVAFLSACSSKTKFSGADIQAMEPARKDSVMSTELSLPEVPPALTDPVERADYIMEHF